MTYADWRERIGEALDTRFYTLDYLDHVIATGAATFLATERAIIVVEVKRFPAGAMVINGVVAAGELPEVLALIAVAEDLGRSIGCTGAMIESREGWARALKPHGYRPFQVSLFKEL